MNSHLLLLFIFHFSVHNSCAYTLPSLKLSFTSALGISIYVVFIYFIIHHLCRLWDIQIMGVKRAISFQFSQINYDPYKNAILICSHIFIYKYIEFICLCFQLNCSTNYSKGHMILRHVDYLRENGIIKSKL